MQNIIPLFDFYGIFFLFFLIAATDAGLPIPIPYDLVIMLSGQRALPLWKVVVAVTSGAVVGNSILYYLARTFGYRFLANHERFFFLTSVHHQKAETWFLKFGSLFVIAARLVPGLRFSGSFLSGVLRLPFKKTFLPTMIVASSAWAITYYYFGKAVGAGVFWLLHLGWPFRFLAFLPMIVILSFVLGAILWAKRGRKKSESHSF